MVTATMYVHAQCAIAITTVHDTPVGRYSTRKSVRACLCVWLCVLLCVCVMLPLKLYYSDMREAESGHEFGALA